MTKAGAPLQTPGQWLLRSLGWTLGGVGGWLALSAAVLEKPCTEETPAAPLFFLGFALLHGLLWWRAVPGLTNENGASWAGLLAFTWLVGLVAFQLISLSVVLVTLASALFYEPVNLG